MKKHFVLGSLVRTSLPFFAAALLLPGCGGKDDPEKDGVNGPTGITEGTSCEEDRDCDDFIYCNGEESCVDGFCRQGERVDCDDGIDCTVDRCKEDTQSCESLAADLDGDGHQDAACEDSDGSPLGDDCDDDDALSFPGNREICDSESRDEDCDPSTFGDQDSDQDGFVDALCCNEQADGDLLCGDDCDDKKTNVNPAATEACDFLDNDCDTKTDEGVSINVFEDKDHDGRGDDAEGTVKSCAGAVGFAVVGGDCDDEDPEVFDGQFEICDGKDNNCNIAIDEVQEQAPWYKDEDEDGYGDPGSTPILSCYRIEGRVLSQNDCADDNNKVNPNATEVCDALDNDCNGVADFRLTGANNFEDDDSDGAADAECGGTDCDDRDPRTSEGAQEVCDKIDNDCDGEVDEQTVQNIWYIDEDGDGWGVVIGSALASCDPIADRAVNFGDCDDGNRDVKPGVAEQCDGQDDDCDGSVDEGAGVHCEIPNALSTCQYGNCAIFSCLPGFADADYNAANGCEAVVDPASLLTTDPCVVDLDCNDENLCNGIETCLSGFCRRGTPINCDAGTGVIQGDVVINDGRDIKDMDGIERITGDLTIDSTLLSSLIGLESLKIVGGNLFIQNNGNLIRLSGSALSNLEVVGGDIVIQNNPNLISVSLPSLVSANALSVLNNDNLVDVGGFPNLANLDKLLVIADNDALSTISGFEALTRVGGAYDTMFSEGACFGTGGVEVSYNYNLSEINAFGALGRIEGDLCLLENPALESIALPNLYAVDTHLRISGIEFATEIDLPGLDTVGASFAVTAYGGEGGPPVLQTVSAPQLTTVEGNFEFSGDFTDLETVSFPLLESVAGMMIDVSGPVAALNFNSLQTAQYLTVYYSGAQLNALVFPNLTTVDQTTLIATMGPISGVRFPKLTDAGDISVSLAGQAAGCHVRFPVLTQTHLGGVYVYSPYTSNGLAELDLGALGQTASDVTLDFVGTSVDISSLNTVGLANISALTLCVLPADICPDAVRLETAGWLGLYNDCGAACLLAQ